MSTTTHTRTANWAGNVVFEASAVHTPRSLEELRRLVRDSPRIRALGSGHSFSRVADTPGELVRLDGLPGIVEIDLSASTATVAAGSKYGEVAAELHRAGFALANMASLPHISVGGAVATGTHGSGDGQRCLAASVARVRMVGPDGDVIELSRASDPGTFPGSVVALGALGVVIAVTLDIEPAYQMTQRVRLDVPLEAVAERFDEVFGAAYSVSVFTDWRSDSAAVWLKDRTDTPRPGWSGGRPAVVPMNPVPAMPADSSTVQMGIPGPWHQRLPHFRPELTPGAGEELQSEFYLPRTAAPQAIAALRDLGDLLAPVLHIAEIRTVRADDLWLSPAYARDSATFHFTWIRQADAVRPVLAAVEERLVPLGARPHWGKLTGMSGTAIAALYERADAFHQWMRDLDPTGKFGNPFLETIFPAQRSEQGR